MNANSYDELVSFLTDPKLLAGLNKMVRGNLKNKSKGFRLIDGVLFKVNGDKLLRVIKQDEVKEVIAQNHDPVQTAHLRIIETFHKVSAQYYWPGIYESVREYVNACTTCQSIKTSKKNQQPLNPIAVKEVFELVGIDIIGPFPETDRKNRYVLVVTEYLTKWVQAIAIADKKASTVAFALFNDYICKFGTFKTLQSNQGIEFWNNVMDELLDIIKTIKTLTANRFQINGITGFVNQTICQMLKKYGKNKQNDWYLMMKLMVFDYNISVQASTKFTPYYLMFARNPIIPWEFQFPTADLLVEEKVAIDMAQVASDRKKALSNIQKAEELQKKRNHEKWHSASSNVGDQVHEKSAKGQPIKRRAANANPAMSV